jgi:hypothetical protein
LDSVGPSVARTPGGLKEPAMMQPTVPQRFRPWLVLVLLAAGCQTPRINAPPEAAVLAPDKPAYFLCDKCGSLDGGSYVDSQTKQLRTPEGDACIHEWFPISRNEFRELGTERFGIDWKLEGPQWQGLGSAGVAGSGAAPANAEAQPVQPAQDNLPAGD